jgi:putative hemolysin
MNSQLMPVILRCNHCVVIASSSSHEAADADFATIRLFDNRDKDKAGELETIYSYSLCTSSFHRMHETLVEGGDVSNTFAHH